VTLPRSFARQIVAHALADDPIECCGIVAGVDGRATKLYRAENSEASPFRYNVHPRELKRIYDDIEDSGLDVFAIYHSHTGSAASPSGTDVRLAAWPEAYYLIVSLADLTKVVLRAFRIVDGVVTEEELSVKDDDDELDGDAAGE